MSVAAGEIETGGSQAQDLPGTGSELKASQSDSVQPCLKAKSAKRAGTNLSGRALT